jgi:hypothetical protein
VLAVMCSEHLPELLVPALADEVQVDLADGRREAVRVIGGPLVVAVACPDAVVDRAGFEGACPDPVSDVAERHDAAVGEQRVHRIGERAPGADDGVHAGSARKLESVLAEHGVRVGVAALRDGGEHVVGDCRPRGRHPVRHRNLGRRAGCALAG